jgi:hypothetical protein
MMLITHLIMLATAAGPALAQAPIKDYYDTDKPFTIKGTFRASVALPGQAPSMVLIEVPGEGGKTVQWLIAGRPAAVLQREGLFLIGPTSPIKSGDVITVAGYLPKRGSKAAEAIAVAMEESAPPGVKPGFVNELRQEDVKLLYAREIVLSDGTKLPFGE